MRGFLIQIWERKKKEIYKYVYVCVYIYIYINKIFLNIIIRFSQNVYRDDKKHFHLLILSGRVKLTEWV